MTFTNLGINSAGTKDWLEAMKNQSSSGISPSHSSGVSLGVSREGFESAVEQASGGKIRSKPAAKKKVKTR